jgi:geranylgeranyl diphosphate synthase type II
VQHNLETVKQVIYKKTVTLFEGSFVLGWVFGGGDHTRLETVKKAAYHIGVAFQIADDIIDLQSDAKRQNEMNIAKFLGRERAHDIFEEEMEKFKMTLHDLQIHTPSFEKLCTMVTQSIS